MTAVARLLLRRPTVMARVHAIAHRTGDRACWLCAATWSVIEAMPGFADGMRQAEADFAAGRTVVWDPRSDD